MHRFIVISLSEKKVLSFIGAGIVLILILKCLSYLLTSTLVPHENGCHTLSFASQVRFLLDLSELEETLLVQLDALLQDAEQHFQRCVLQRRLDHVQQGLVLDQPLLNLRGLK